MKRSKDEMITQEIWNRGLRLRDVNYADCEICDACNTVLLPDDECYSELETHKALCTECCFYDEYLDSYVRGTIEASNVRLRVELDVS